MHNVGISGLLITRCYESGVTKARAIAINIVVLFAASRGRIEFIFIF